MALQLFPRLIILSCFVWYSSTQLNQYQQFLQQALNRQNGRGPQSAAFMLSRGHRNPDPENNRFITFETVQFAANALTYREFGAFRVEMPGIYFMSFTIRGNTTSGTEVQLRGTGGRIFATAIVPDDSQVTSNSIMSLARNETVYLEILSGGILENVNNNGSYNSFMGFLLVAEDVNPYLQNAFTNNQQNPNNFQNVGGFNNFGAGNFLGNSFGAPFTT